jgi:magnesium transporter
MASCLNLEDPAMLRIYSTREQKFLTLPGTGDLQLTSEMIWIDLSQPSPEEEVALEKQLGFDLPTREEMKDIEPSSRLYQENGVTYMTAAVVVHADGDDPEITNVGFILAGGRLITIRYAEPKPFAHFSNFIARESISYANGAALLAGLLEALVDRLAEILEKTGAEIDAIGKRVFYRRSMKGKRVSGEVLEGILNEIALHQNKIGKVRDSLVSLSRLASYCSLTAPVTQEAAITELLRSVAKDIPPLTDHATYLSGNLTFMLDAALGLINIEQNAIIKIFSVAAVVFLPPTLVASIYGMNFEFMPELHWVFGYPMALALMILSAIVPYGFFKSRGWL